MLLDIIDIQVEGMEVEWTLGLALAEECEHNRLLEYKQDASDSAQRCVETVDSVRIGGSSGKTNDLPRIAALSVLERFSYLVRKIERRIRSIF